MNSHHAPTAPLEVELLVPLSKRRTLPVDQHQEWRDWIRGGPARTRKDAEVDHLNSVLDELEIERERRSA